MTATYKKANGYIAGSFEIHIDPAHHPTSHEFLLNDYDDDSNYLELVVKSGTTGKLNNVEFSVGPFSGFVVTKDGLLTATNAQILGTFQGNVTITGGSLSIGNGKFKVTNAGELTATAGTIGGFNILADSLSTVAEGSSGTNFNTDNLILQKNGTVVADKIIFNTYNTALKGGYFRNSTAHLSYRDYYYSTVISTDYLFPWGVVSAYNTDPYTVSQNVMPFDSVISLSPAMRGINHDIKYYDPDNETAKVEQNVHKRIGKHLGLYIWNYDGEIAADKYVEMTASDMGFAFDSVYLFAVASQKNFGDLSYENHANKLSTCVIKSPAGCAKIRVYNDGGSAKDGFVCFIVGIIADSASTNSLYLSSGGALSKYAGKETTPEQTAFNNDNLYYKTGG